MSKQDLLKTQTCVLRVNIDCEGCKNKVKRTLQKIDGVYAVAIDMQQGKVTVTGNVEPGVLLKRLEKSGKRAELYSSDKDKSSEKSKKSGFDENVNDQLKKLLQLGNGKGGGDDDVKKPQQKGGKEQQKSGAINVSGDGKNLQQMKFQELLEQMKSGSKDFNMKGPQKPPGVKVESLPGKGVGRDFGDFSSGDDLDGDDDYSDDDEFDEDDDEFDEDEEEFDDEEEEEEELDYGSDQNQKQQKTFMPIMSNDLGKEKKGGGGGEKAKKGGGGGGGIMSMIGRAIGGNNEGKDGNLGKKGGGEGGGKSQGGGKKGGESKSSGGDGGPKNGGEGKIGKKGGGGGGKDGGFQGVVVPNHTKGGGGGGGMGQMGQYPVGPMGPQFPATPIMNGGGGGYYQGSMGPVPAGNPYQQQQYMAMMMNQQRMMNGAGMYHPAMFGRPPPGYGYVPPMPPPAYNDHITHMFSDENPGSCSIM